MIIPQSDESFIKIRQTRFTPYVSFDLASQTLKIRGTCMPEFPARFFAPINHLLEKYPSFNLSKLDVEIDLNYFNSASAKALFFMIKRINRFSHSLDVYIRWHISSYDEESIEIVKDFRTSLELPIDIVLKDELL